MNTHPAENFENNEMYFGFFSSSVGSWEPWLEEPGHELANKIFAYMYAQKK
jgi:hypothetical protein